MILAPRWECDRGAVFTFTNDVVEISNSEGSDSTRSGPPTASVSLRASRLELLYKSNGLVPHCAVI